MSSLVATGKLRQDGLRRTVQTFNYNGSESDRANAAPKQSARLRLFDEVNFADAAFHFEMNGRGTLAIDFVRIFVIIVTQTMRIDAADTARGSHHHADFLR